MCVFGALFPRQSRIFGDQHWFISHLSYLPFVYKEFCSCWPHEFWVSFFTLPRLFSRFLRVIDPRTSIVVSPSFPGGVGITCWLVVCNKVVAIMLHPFSWRNPSRPWTPQLYLHYLNSFRKKKGQLASMRQGLRQSLLLHLDISHSFWFLFPEFVFQSGKSSTVSYKTSFWVIHGRTVRFCHGLLSPTSTSVGFVVLSWKCAGFRN